jgi:hypothetical protein
MCGTSTDPGSKNGDGRIFTMSMNGRPSGTVAGGFWKFYYGDTTPRTGNFSWNLKDKDNGGINGMTMQVNAVYVEPQPATIQGGVSAVGAR